MDGYSRIVAIFKVVLPLAALAILSTLFLLSRGADEDAIIPFSEADIENRLRDQQITAPFFSGVTPNGEEVMVTAERARPGVGGSLPGAENLSGRIRLSNGADITLTATEGTIDPAEDRVTFDGAVRIVTSTGFEITTDTLHSALDKIDAATPGPVFGTGPMGRFDAGQMRITAKSETENVHLLFQNGVKLIYDPKLQER
ncbi:LPS export ABC transporter periplasmic protein LptC [Thalassococcus sp. S3]|uniref:LPS export ABC transporter periplasmic protein LptC n=1 Tax=Thalassococcus sp. S3 TaxID=2017482 RepID=UPI001023F898|nr:LPS export ABC transporter periplasmic protein LptC [Thalassococcus sp. S3]QBF34069.1 hypothetical protein CFI11_23085 [Thalassococcus sp. S3]